MPAWYVERTSDAVATPAMMQKSDARDSLPFDDAIEMFYFARNSNVTPGLLGGVQA